jgi:hypothetical protein
MSRERDGAQYIIVPESGIGGGGHIGTVAA